MENITRPMFCYLAGPIDGIDAAEANGWREQLVHDYPRILFFMPTTAYGNVSKLSFREVMAVNQQAIAWSDSLLADLSGNGRGIGTIREIEQARQMGKPVALICHDADPDALAVQDLALVNSAAEGINILMQAVMMARKEEAGV